MTLTKFAQPLYDMVEALQRVLPNTITTNNYADFMQTAGDWLRGIDPYFFVKEMKRKIDFLSDEENQALLIDDLRFKNELELMKQEKALLIRLDCPIDVRRKRAEKWRTNVIHNSEIDLDDRIHEFHRIFDSEKQNAEDIALVTLDVFKKMHATLNE